MLPIGEALAQFDSAIVSWVGMPHPAASGEFRLTITVLVWRSVGLRTRAAIRRALVKYFTPDKLWHIVEDMGDTAYHATQNVSLKVRVVTFQGDGQ